MNEKETCSFCDKYRTFLFGLIGALIVSLLAVHYWNYSLYQECTEELYKKEVDLEFIETYKDYDKEEFAESFFGDKRYDLDMMYLECFREPVFDEWQFKEWIWVHRGTGNFIELTGKQSLWHGFVDPDFPNSLCMLLKQSGDSNIFCYIGEGKTMKYIPCQVKEVTEIRLLLKQENNEWTEAIK